MPLFADADLLAGQREVGVCSERVPNLSLNLPGLQVVRQRDAHRRRSAVVVGSRVGLRLPLRDAVGAVERIPFALDRPLRGMDYRGPDYVGIRPRSRQASTSAATTRSGKPPGRAILVTKYMFQACTLKHTFY